MGRKDDNKELYTRWREEQLRDPHNLNWGDGLMEQMLEFLVSGKMG